jgi:DHA2 family multidrug resistance protein
MSAVSAKLPLEYASARPRAGVNPWIISVAVMLATFMEVLDTSIANVALPHIAGNLSASMDESTWVLTSYLVSNAIVLPATGWLSSFFGRKRFLIVCIGIFTLASVLCGMATSLPMLIAARILQGAGGGALQPIAQAIMLESFPPAKRGAAMAVYGLGVVVAPIIGPALGGWITDQYSWRWTFYINLPVGIVAIVMAQAFVHDPDYIKKAARKTIDYLGFGLMAVWLATLQVVLDKGQQEDWFGSRWIVWLTVISVVALVSFVVRELKAKEPIVDLRVLANRNFALGTALIFLVGVVLYGTIALLPLFLQTLMGYPALQAGLATSPRGLGSFVAMFVVGRIVGKFDNRWIMLFGFAVLGFSAYEFGAITLDIAMSSVVWPGIINGFALGFLFVPLTNLAMGLLPNEQMGNATGIYNLMRNLGGGVGIAWVTTLLARGSQTAQANLAANTSAYNPIFQERLASIAHGLAPQVGAATAQQQAYGMIYGELNRQAAYWAYINDFRFLAAMCLACLPLCFLFKKVAAKAGAVAAH